MFYMKIQSIAILDATGKRLLPSQYFYLYQFLNGPLISLYFLRKLPELF